jgi:hypothetical protein
VLTVDVGGLVARRRQMVNANDAAALAAAKAFALNENGADCGVNETPAQTFATSLASQNVDAPNLALFDTDCAEQTVTVEYDKQQDLFFAPALGFGDSARVTASATAKWGQAMGGNPIPVELDPGRTNRCVFLDENNPDGGYRPAGRCPEGYWFDPNETDQNSAWGLLSLNEWAPENGANDPQAACSASGGSDDLAGQIDGSETIEVVLAQVPTYVCTRTGASTSTWLDALRDQACGEAEPPASTCKTFLFPVNDPSRMVVNNPWLPTQVQASSTNREKYAIVAFAPMQIVAVYDGDDPEAIGTVGTPAQNVPCDIDLNLSVAGTVNLGTRATESCNAPPSVDAIPYTSVEVYSGNGRNRVTFTKCPPVGGTNCDYRYDETTYDLTWVNVATRGGLAKQVKFNWVINAVAGTEGACARDGVPPTTPPSRAFCLVLRWAGPQLIGQQPGPPGPGFGAQAIALIK